MQNTADSVMLSEFKKNKKNQKVIRLKQNSALTIQISKNDFSRENMIISLAEIIYNYFHYIFGLSL